MLTSMDKGVIGNRIDDSILFSDSFGLLQYGDGSWRIFPLETDNTFVIRGCEGEFMARVERLTPSHYLAKRQDMRG